MSEILKGMFGAVVAMIFLGMTIYSCGYHAAKSRDAIKSGCAYYHPKTAEIVYRCAEDTDE